MVGIQLCERIHGTKPDTPVIVVTGVGDLESAIAAIRVGAYDFLLPPNPWTPTSSSHSVARAVEHRRIHDEVRRLPHDGRGRLSPSGSLIGESAAMRSV